MLRAVASGQWWYTQVVVICFAGGSVTLCCLGSAGQNCGYARDIKFQ